MLCVIEPDKSPIVEIIFKEALVEPDARHWTAVALTHSVASHAVAEKRALTVLSRKAICPPAIVTLTEPVLATFAGPIHVTKAALNDHASDVDPPTFPAVMDILRVWCIPETILQVTLDMDSHSEDSDAVDPRFTRIDRSRLTEVSVMVPLYECTGTLLGFSVLKNGTLNDHVSVKLPESMPLVTAARNVLNVPPGPRQRTSVSLTHSVASAAVPWILCFNVESTVPSPAPCKVMLMDPVVGQLTVDDILCVVCACDA
jgi:hypothetical protein